ncbi:MAG TPA: hypothetical protein VGK90_08850 [Rhizomicrobium sp.]
MSAFEHIIVLLSFVYALALTHLLSGVAYLIRAGSRVRFSWIQAGWMLNALLTIVANWIGFWDMRQLPSWGVGTIMFTLAMAIANYLQAALVCPEVFSEGPIDLAAFHEQQGRRYIVAFVISLLFALSANVLFGSAYNLSEWSEQDLAVVPMLFVSVLAAVFLGRKTQIVLLVCLAGIWGFYFTKLQAALH